MMENEKIAKSMDLVNTLVHVSMKAIEKMDCLMAMDHSPLKIANMKGIGIKDTLMEKAV